MKTKNALTQVLRNLNARRSRSTALRQNGSTEVLIQTLRAHANLS